MNEESACLVPPPLRSSQNGITDPQLLPTPNGVCPAGNGEALVGFHEDALSQATVGKAQCLLTLILGLALAADCSELIILNYILPSAELQLCIGDHRKWWLVSITLVAMSVGSVCWGVFGDKIGRRRALLSSLSVAGLFSAVATVMPTYGTFMTARFCSGLGISGAAPLAFSYLAETCPRKTRTRYMGLLYAFWPLGAIFTSTLAYFILPEKGADIVSDNREHWSSWHRFLILNILPTVACIVGLTWTSESPRYLLEAAREVEALEVYQRLHKLNKSRTQYGLTELELPGRGAYRDRPIGSLTNSIRCELRTYGEVLQRVVSPSYYPVTVILPALHIILGFLFTGVSIFSTSMIKQFNDAHYNALTKNVSGASFFDTNANITIENVLYTDSTFRNISFRHLEFSHVRFVECVFDGVEFSNVKSSMTRFVNSTIRDCRFVDTDLTERHFINCNMFNNTFIALISDCTIDFDYNIYMSDMYKETIIWAVPAFFVLILAGVVLQSRSRPSVLIASLSATALTAIGIWFVSDFLSMTLVEMFLKNGLLCCLSALMVVVVEAFPCYMRCSAHGILRSMFHLASFCAVPIFSALTHTHQLLPSSLTASVAILGVILSLRVQDNSKTLL